MAELVLWLTLTVYKEARGEPPMCQMAVAHVVLERSARAGLDVRSIVLQQSQFSWVATDMVNGVLKPHAKPDKNSMGWKQSEESAIKAIYTTAKQKATHFHAVYIDKPKSWVGLKWVQTCGGHHFYS